MLKPTHREMVDHPAEHFSMSKAAMLAALRVPLHPHDMRDEFAGCALAGLAAGPDSYSIAELATTSYAIADAMLEARLPKEKS